MLRSKNYVGDFELVSYKLNPHIGGLKFCNYDVVKRKIDSKLGGDMDDVKTTSGDEDGRQALPFTKFQECSLHGNRIFYLNKTMQYLLKFMIAH